jgi:hypothetical protein
LAGAKRLILRSLVKNMAKTWLLKNLSQLLSKSRGMTSALLGRETISDGGIAEAGTGKITSKSPIKNRKGKLTTPL